MIMYSRMYAKEDLGFGWVDKYDEPLNVSLSYELLSCANVQDAWPTSK